MRNNSKVTLVIVLVIIIFALYVMLKPNPNTEKETVECIASKSILYVQQGCFACEKQKELFGSNYNLLNVVDCAFERNRCIEAKITATPTWIIDEEEYRGLHSIEELKELTSC